MGVANGVKIDWSSLATIIGSVLTFLGVTIAGWFTWKATVQKVEQEHKKADQESISSTQASLISGFKLLLDESNTSRDRLIKRNDELEVNNAKQDRYIAQLVRTLVNNNIPIPEEQK